MDAPAEDLAEHQMSGETVNLHNQKQGLDDLGVGGGEKRWPGWPGESVFRILVPSHKVGGIIGRKGEFIKRMCEESRARIKILDGPPSATERAVIISAKEEHDTSISPAMDGLLRVHTRIVDGLDGEHKEAPSIGGNMVPTRLLVAASQAGTLIGKHGATIKSIQEASNSTVRILDDLPPIALQDDRVVEIQGEPTAVHRALELIANHLRRFLVDRSVLPLFEMHMSMPRPHMEQNMQYMPPQNMPPPQPWGHPQGLPPNAGGPDYGGNPQFMPPRDNFYPPPEYSHYEKRPHHGISTYGQDATPMGVHLSNNQQPQQMVSQVAHQMQVPLLYADAVIGAAGSNISYIRRSSGAAITIQESRGAPGEMTVEINGTATQVQTAQQLIQNFMAGAGAPAPPPAPVQNHPVGPADQGYGHPMGPADQGYGSYPMGPADQGYGSYPAAHGPVYGSPPSNAGPAAHAGGGYGSGYGANYGY